MDVAQDLKLDRLRAKYPQLQFNLDGSKVQIGPQGHESVVTIERELDRWTVSTREWHGHEEEPGVAMLLAIEIMCGAARTAQEFRGETLSATWIEVRNETGYEWRDPAYFLNPFDAGEWELREG